MKNSEVNLKNHLRKKIQCIAVKLANGTELEVEKFVGSVHLWGFLDARVAQFVRKSFFVEEFAMSLT